MAGSANDVGRGPRARPRPGAAALPESPARAAARGRSLRRHLGLLADRHALERRTRVRLTAGEPVDELRRVADERDAALVIVGTRGRRELGRAVVGSVSSGLMLSAPCPVAVVPPEAPVAPDLSALRSAVCGVEGAHRDRAVLRLAADLVNRIGGELHALHSFDARPAASPAALPSVPPDELRVAREEMLARAIAASGVVARGHIVEGAPATSLEHCAEREGAGLVVVGSQGLGRVGSVVLGSVAIRLIATTRRPVVVLPPHAELAPHSGHYETQMSPS